MAAAMARVTMREVMKNRRSSFFPQQSFFFSSSSSPSTSKIALIDSEEDLISAFKLAQEEASPAIFYFTAAWCGPCKLISPIFETLAKRHSRLSCFKVDIDNGGLVNMLSQLDITSVPTFHFYKDGKKADQFTGADWNRLKTIMDTLYTDESNN